MDTVFKMPVQLRWSDFDANFHLRHSAYYDFGALARIACMSQVGLNENTFRKNGFGPILFKEECIFRKEIHLHDEIFITCELMSFRTNGSRFTIKHQLFKKDETLAAEINILGDWIDTATRKLYHPPAFLAEMMHVLPKSKAFIALP